MGQKRGRSSEGLPLVPSGALTFMSVNEPRLRRTPRRSNASEPQQNCKENENPQGKVNADGQQIFKHSSTRSSPGTSQRETSRGKRVRRNVIEEHVDVSEGNGQKDGSEAQGVVKLPPKASRGDTASSERIRKNATRDTALEETVVVPRSGAQEGQLVRDVQQALHCIPDLETENGCGNSQGGARVDVRDEFLSRLGRLECPSEEARTLLTAYDKLFVKYKRIKTRKAEVDALFEEQKQQHLEFRKVADDYIQLLSTENEHLRKQFEESEYQAAQDKLRWLERVYLESQNDVVRERARNLELQQRIHELDSAVLRNSSDLVHHSQLLPDEQAPPEDVFTQDHSLHQSPGEQACEQVARQESGSGKEPGGLESAVLRDSPDLICHSQPPPEEQATQEEVLTQGNNLHQSLEEQAWEIPHPESGSHKEFGGPKGELQLVPVQNILGNEIDLNEDTQSLQIIKPSAKFLNTAVPVVEVSADCICSCGNPTLKSSEREIVAVNSHNADADASVRAELTTKNLHLRKKVANVMAECYLLQKLLEQMTGLRVVPDKSLRVLGSTPKSIFSHHSTGTTFRLWPVGQSWPELGKKMELEYQCVDLGTLEHVAPAWMREDMTITLEQLEDFVNRFHGAATCGFIYK